MHEPSGQRLTQLFEPAYRKANPDLGLGKAFLYVGMTGLGEMEVELAIGLREAGYGVWQA